MTLRAVLLTACIWAMTAQAATALDVQRGSARTLRAQVTALKADQLTQRSELSKVSARIETLKANSQGALLSGSELDSALKRSQELSGALTELAQKVTARESELESANLVLLDSLSTELTSARAQFDRSSDRPTRLKLIDDMKRLRAEREAIRAMLPASKVPNLETLRASDDPEELLEQAELVRDNEEKVSKELKVVETRLRERREELDLDRRVQRFLGEESMFDDQDSRLRVQRTTTLSLQQPAARSTVDASNVAGTQSPAPGVTSKSDTSIQVGSAPPTNVPGSTSKTAADNSFSAFGGTSPQGATVPREASPGTTSNLDNAGLKVTNGSDARPQVGAPHAVTTGDDDDVDGLEVERARLQSLATQLKVKAAQLEKRAAQLK